VTLFDKFFADDVLVKGLLIPQERHHHHNMSSLSFNGMAKTSFGEFRKHRDEREERFPCAAAFVAIGQIPDNDRFANLSSSRKASSSR
jgi:thioredoxin reductase